MSSISLTDLISSTFSGNTGPGVANGGVVDQALVKSSNADFDTTWVTLDTDFVLEGNTNLYFTESRTIGAIETNTVNSVSIESNFILPVGNTDSRPSPAVVGMMRFNSELNVFEGYDGNEWIQFVISSAIEGDLDTQSGTEDLEEGSGTVDLMV